MADYKPTYEFIPLPFFDENDLQFKPSVKVLLDGHFVHWTVYDLGFDDPRFTMPYAREFARNEADMCKQSADHLMSEWNNRFG